MGSWCKGDYPNLVQGWVSKAVHDGLSPRSIRKFHTLLHSIFKVAVRDRIITYNPSDGTSLPKVISTRRATITPAQFDALLAAISRQHRALLQVGIETGMRWGELAALRPRHLTLDLDLDLDLNRATVLVAETIVEISKKDFPTRQRYTRKPHPKDDQHRTPAITPELASILMHRIATLGLQPDDLLFPSTTRDTQQPTNRSTFCTRTWRPALQAAGLPLTIRMHDLRHAHASWLLPGGADLKTALRTRTAVDHGWRNRSEHIPPPTAAPAAPDATLHAGFSRVDPEVLSVDGAPCRRTGSLTRR